MVNYIIRPAESVSEIKSILQETEANSWNCGLSDGDTFFISVAKGFIVAVLESESETEEKVIGCVTCTKYDNNTGWLGPFLMRPHLQRQGIGSKLFEAGLQYFKDQGITNFGLDGVLNMASSYEKRGFKKICSEAGLHVKLGKLLSFQSQSSRAIKDSNVPIDDLVALDKECTGMDRSAIWQRAKMHLHPSNFGWIIRNNDEKITGWLHLRKCTSGYRIGPLYANDGSIAEELVQHAVYALKDQGPESVIFINILEGNQQALELIKSKYGFESLVEFAHMWYGDSVPTAQTEKNGKLWAILDASVG